MMPTEQTRSLRHSRMRSPAVRTISSVELLEQRDAGRYLLYSSDFSEALRESLWTDPDELIRKGQPLKLGNRTSVVKLQSADRAYVLKRYNLRGRLHTAVHAFLRSRACRCWNSAHMLQSVEINTPRPVAMLEQHTWGLGLRSFLVTEYVPGKRLSDYFSHQRYALAQSANNRHTWLQDQQRFVLELSHIWKKLATRKLSHGDMKLANFLVSDQGRLSLIDLDSMQQHQNDITWEWARSKDWTRLLRDLKGYPDFIQELRIAGRAHDASLTSFQEELYINEQFQSLLQQNGLNSVPEIMDSQQGHMLRRLPDRENWRLDLKSPNQKPYISYLKKHRQQSGKMFSASWMHSNESSPGDVEAENIRALQACAIPTMTLIAHGTRTEENGRHESFVLTEELTGYQQLDLFLEERFPEGTPPRDLELKKLLQAVAGVAARFHTAGFNHRDFYTCHFFIKEVRRPEVQFDVRLIDLQRVQQRQHAKRRWIVKDLAQLAYSTPQNLIDCSMRMRFIKRYFAVSKLGTAEKNIIRKVIAKENFMKWKLGPYR